MEFTIRIPTVGTMLRHWKWGLLALFAVALTFTGGGKTTQPAEAGAPFLITIQKYDRDTGGKLPGSCFMLLWEWQEPILEVCDNGPGDLDATPGWIVFVAPAEPGVYHVVETRPPVGYNMKEIKYQCAFDGSGMPLCQLDVPNDQKGSEININKVGVAVKLPGSCFDVEDEDNLEVLFSVCDNDFQEGYPQSDPLCAVDGTPECEDNDPAPGSIRVAVAAGIYSLREIKAPVNHNPIPGKQLCDATIGDKCDLVFENTSKTRPWHPWDLNGDGLVRVKDIMEVVNNYGNDKPLAEDD